MPRFLAVIPVLAAAVVVMAPLGFIYFSASMLAHMCDQGMHPIAPSRAEIALFAQDVHIMVGEVPLVIPFIAVPQLSHRDAFARNDHRFPEQDIERVAFAAQASHADSAPKLDWVTMRGEQYGHLHETNYWMKVCGQLTRNGSRSVCDDPFVPLQQTLPRGSFTLDDARHLDASQKTYLPIDDLGEAAPLLQSMTLIQGEPEPACGVPYKLGASRLCLVALRLGKDLVAIWFVQDGPKEAALSQARREGQAVAARVAHGLGSVENFPALVSAACATLRPDAKPLRSGDGDWPCQDGWSHLSTIGT